MNVAIQNQAAPPLKFQAVESVQFLPSMLSNWMLSPPPFFIDGGGHVQESQGKKRKRTCGSLSRKFWGFAKMREVVDEADEGDGKYEDVAEKHRVPEGNVSRWMKNKEKFREKAAQEDLAKYMCVQPVVGKSRKHTKSRSRKI